MGLDDFLLAGFQRPVEIGGDVDVRRNEARVRKACAAPGEIDQHETGAELVGRLLDLGEAVHGRGIDPGNQAEIE